MAKLPEVSGIMKSFLRRRRYFSGLIVAGLLILTGCVTTLPVSPPQKYNPAEFAPLRVDARKLEAQASEVLHRLGVDISPRTKVGRLSVAQQQMIEIAKALSVNAQVVIMDEPSATLGGQDLEHVFEVISALKQRGRPLYELVRKGKDLEPPQPRPVRGPSPRGPFPSRFGMINGVKVVSL